MAYYNSYHSSVIFSSLDATESFDSVNYCELCKLSVTHHFSARVTRSLSNRQPTNLVRVALGGVLSEYFSAVNGASPVLYYVGIDNLLLASSNSGVGRYTGNNCVVHSRT
jgi:hypothetical protein